MLQDPNYKLFLEEYVDRPNPAETVHCLKCNKVFKSPFMQGETTSYNKCHLKHCAQYQKETRKIIFPIQNDAIVLVKNWGSDAPKILSKYDNMNLTSMMEEKMSVTYNNEKCIVGDYFCDDVRATCKRNKFFASFQDYLQVIQPPLQSRALQLLSMITNYITNHETELQRIMDNEKKKFCGFTKIQSCRYEIFCEGKGVNETRKKHILYEYIIPNIVAATQGEEQGEDTNEMIDPIKFYSISQARRDPRIFSFMQDYEVEFINFSFIISFGQSMQQDYHIDSLYPNFQFSVTCIEGAPMTQALHVPEIESIQTFEELYNAELPLLSGITKTLNKKLLFDKSVTELIYNYGNLFAVSQTAPNIDVAYMPEETKVNQVGTTTCLPGSVIHAGPACPTTRVVLFFTTGGMKPKKISTKETCDVSKKFQVQTYDIVLYGNDSQYSQVTLFSEVVIKLWSNINYKERKYLLEKLHVLIRRNNFQEDKIPDSYHEDYYNYLHKCIEEEPGKNIIGNVHKLDSLNAPIIKRGYRLNMQLPKEGNEEAVEI